MLEITEILLNYMSEEIPVTAGFTVGWVMRSDKTNVMQKKYHLIISEQENLTSPIYDSGLVYSEDSAHIKPEFTPLSIREYWVSVTVTDNYGDTAEKKRKFISGYKDLSEWHGSYISAERFDDAEKSYGTYLRRDFCAAKQIRKAYFTGTGCGMYEAFINGNKVGNDYFAPGWTSYDTHQQYQVYDISELVRQGENTIGISLGAGWFKGTMSYNMNRNHYGVQTAFSGCVILDYEDGERVYIESNTFWKGTQSPVLFSEIYDGEIYDSRLEKKGWSEPDYDDSSWDYVGIVDRSTDNLFPQECGGVEVHEKLKAKLVITPEGDKVLDFGQNLTGWCNFQIQNASRGDVIELQCFETLDTAGNVYTANLRQAKQMIQYICNGENEEYHPSFTFQGFRYVHVRKWPGELNEGSFQALVLHSKMERTGFFECSDNLLNRLQHNITWSMKGNFVDVPTDCPQRNERLGWTGDVQIFNSTAMFLMNAYGFFSKWLRDVAADQSENGGVPHVVPDIISGKSDEDWLTKQGCEGASAWADVAVILPWNMYLAYGDVGILERQYVSMKRWIDFMQEHSSEGCLFRYKLQFGDWVALDAEEGSYFGATPTDYTSAAFFCYSTRLFAKIANLTGHEEDAVHYSDLAKALNKSFQEHFLKEDGHLRIETQTAQIVALYFDLIPEKFKSTVAGELRTLIEKNNGHLITGFIGTPYICHALSDNGYIKDAYNLLMKTDFPSWLYQVTKGATTVWEHWDGLKPDGSMWSPDMNSFNHYSYGSVGDWMYKNIGGLRPDPEKPGYCHFYVQVQTDGRIHSAETRFRSIYGTIRTNWLIRDDRHVQLEVEVPVNTTAEIKLENGEKYSVGSGKYHFDYVKQ